jgi:hypothetical protein
VGVVKSVMSEIVGTHMEAMSYNGAGVEGSPLLKSVG